MTTKREQENTAKQLLETNKIPQTPQDYSNVYFKACLASNSDISMTEYVKTQCGCTALKMVEFMSIQDMKHLFSETKEGDFQQGRVMMLAYMPCMYTSVNQFVFDNCFYDDNSRTKLRRPRKTCECYARNMGNYVASNGQYLVPGFVRDGYDKKKAVPNPLVHILLGERFLRHANEEFEKCVMKEEKGW
ncbi:MAG: hypothetical protein WBK77_07930 [Alphaproteobacteria bacterium]